MVDVVGNPTECEVSMMLIHCLEVSLSGQIIALISSCKISAAVPGSEFKPAFFNSTRNSLTEIFKVFLPWSISKGEKAWIWIDDEADLIALTISR